MIDLRLYKAIAVWILGGEKQGHPLLAVSYTHLTLPTTPYV